MENDSQPKPLPEKVLRRHFELIQTLLPDISRLVISEGRPADVLLNHFLRNHRELGSRDRRVLSQAVFSYFRWYGWTVSRLGLTTEEACLTGVMLDATELHPSFRYMQDQFPQRSSLMPIGDKAPAGKRDALNEWFEAALNGQPLSLQDLLPPEFAEVVHPEAIEGCIQQFQQRPPAWIRTRGDTPAIEQALKEQDIPCSIHERLSAAVAIESGTSLIRSLENYAGQYVVQDITSQAVGNVCAPSPGEEWWDCCSGAGGKALHLMDLMEQNGSVLATDIRNEALKELKKRARRYGIRKIRTHPFNAVADEPYTKTFDGVLVDAPCSGWGTWARNPDARWRTSKREVVQCANRQLKILNNAKWCVKPGGVLVYAVCTLTRPETEEVVMQFLDQHDNFRPDPFINPLNGQDTAGQLQLWPWDGPGDAMFIARFRRTAD
jgi:16S rRNA (cytosine967-C5)-methyltransferase